MYFARCGRQSGVKMPPAMPIESAAKVKATFHLAEFDECRRGWGWSIVSARLPSFAVNFVLGRCRYPFGQRVCSLRRKVVWLSAALELLVVLVPVPILRTLPVLVLASVLAWLLFA